MVRNEEIVKFFTDQFDTLKHNSISFEIINIDEVEDVIALYAEMMDIFNNVTFSKKNKHLTITIYKD